MRETERIELCSSGGCCPCVELGEGEMRIGEEGSWVRLSREEWNTLVRKVLSGELRPI